MPTARLSGGTTGRINCTPALRISRATGGKLGLVGITGSTVTGTMSASIRSENLTQGRDLELFGQVKHVTGEHPISGFFGKLAAQFGPFPQQVWRVCVVAHVTGSSWG